MAPDSICSLGAGLAYYIVSDITKVHTKTITQWRKSIIDFNTSKKYLF